MSTPTPDSQFRQLVIDLSEVVDEAILHAVGGPSDDATLASLAEVRGGIVRMNHALKIVHISIPGDQERTYADELPKPTQQALPKLQPIKTSRVGLKLKKPLSIACPACEAEVDTPCFKYTSRGPNGKPSTERHHRNGPTHAARRKIVREANAKLKAAYDRQHGINNQEETK